MSNTSTWEDRFEDVKATRAIALGDSYIGDTNLKAFIASEREEAKREIIAFAREEFWKYQAKGNAEAMAALHKIINLEAALTHQKQ